MLGVEITYGNIDVVIGEDQSCVGGRKLRGRHLDGCVSDYCGKIVEVVCSNVEFWIWDGVRTRSGA